mgnify:CR=1 FL=1
MKREELKLCEHPKNMIKIINNGGIWCASCGETNILKPNKVLNDKKEIMFEGNGRECNEWINKQNN